MVLSGITRDCIAPAIKLRSLPNGLLDPTAGTETVEAMVTSCIGSEDNWLKCAKTEQLVLIFHIWVTSDKRSLTLCIEYWEELVLSVPWKISDRALSPFETANWIHADIKVTQEALRGLGDG